MLAAVYNAILTSNIQSTDGLPTCSTGNCSWASYRTLAVCSSCQDITYLVTPHVIANYTDLPSHDYTLPNGFQLVQSLPAYTYFNFITSANPLVLGNNGSRLADMQIISSPDQGQVQAHKCALQLCIKTYAANETDGQFTGLNNGHGTTIPTSFSLPIAPARRSPVRAAAKSNGGFPLPNRHNPLPPTSSPSCG